MFKISLKEEYKNTYNLYIVNYGPMTVIKHAITREDYLLVTKSRRKKVQKKKIHFNFKRNGRRFNLNVNIGYSGKHFD